MRNLTEFGESKASQYDWKTDKGSNRSRGVSATLRFDMELAVNAKCEGEVLKVLHHRDLVQMDLG